MTEPSPSPIPTTPSGQSWIDWLGPLDDLWANHPFVAQMASPIMTAAVIALAAWLGKQTWKTWKRKRHAQRVAARRQQLPPVRLPFTVELENQRLTLVPAQPQQEGTTECMSIVRLLSARSNPVPFLDRAGALARLETWARSEDPFAIYVLGGDGGSGKTRLGIELCRCLTDPNTPRRGAEVWKAGFLQNIEQSDNTSSSDNASSLLLVVDYAEAQPEMVKDIIKTVYRAVENPEMRRMRIVFLVRRPSPLAITRRGSNEWIDALRPQESFDEKERKDGNDAINSLLDNTSTIILNDEELSDEERKDLFKSAYSSFTEPSGSLPPLHLLEQLSDPTYSQPLLVTVDAFLNARPLPNSRNGCSPGELFEEVLRHEESYWAEHWPSSLAVNTDRDQQRKAAATPADTQDEKRKSLNRELARQAVATATLTDIQDEEDAISLLQLLPTNPSENIKDLAKWLRDCYPPHMNGNGHSALWCEHLEPDRIGEHLVVSEANNLASLLRELLSPSRVGTSSLRTWTVLERSSVAPRLKENVGQILNDALVEVTQAVQAQVVDSQSPDLATGFAKLFSAVRSHVEPDKAHKAEQALFKGGYLTAFLECELAQCAADISRPTEDASETDRATYASRRLSLSRCLAKTGRRNEALEAAQEATDYYRSLAKPGPSAYDPDLAMSLNNLALRLAENGQRDKALEAAQEATDRYHDLARKDPEVHDPNYATSLNNLALHLAEDGKRDEALKTTKKAVDIRRRLTDQNPAIYAPNLAMSLNNLAIYLSQAGKRIEALQTAHEATNLYLGLADQNPASYISDLATSLYILALHLDENGQHDEALKTMQEAVERYRGLVRSEPHTSSRELVRCLSTYANFLDHYGNAEEAARIRQEREKVLKQIEEMEEGDA